MYEFAVNLDNSGSEARYAGLVKTGKPSFKNPLMGGVDAAPCEG
jgi:hypothetical protein